MDGLLRVESYHDEGGELVRRVSRRDGKSVESRIKRLREDLTDELAIDEIYDGEWLASSVQPTLTETLGRVTVVDVFAGCGGLTLGIGEACRALGLKLDTRLAIDLDPEALSIYQRNFPEAVVDSRPIEMLVTPTRTGQPTKDEQALVSEHFGVDLLVGGPPCQGHSNLNNHTRWADPKNELYMAMARLCELLKPRHVVIENVPGVEKDAGKVAQRTWSRIQALGYKLHSGVLDASTLGTAQARRRSITIASRVITPNIALAQMEVAVPVPRSLVWAISDLSVEPERDPFDTPSNPNQENQRRIEYLFTHKLHDLPDSQRPPCHRLKTHTYTPMYGRLYADRPAPTITTGFGSMGRGRFVHPTEPRLLTPHEAARIQGIPDFFTFGQAKRGLLHKVIGNAVPPKLGYAVGLHLLR